VSEHPIVVGFSGTQIAALRFAAVRAHSSGVALRVVLCVERFSAWDQPSVFDFLQRESGRSVLEVAKGVVDGCVPGVGAEYVRETGSPADLLMREVEGSAMLVVGADSGGWADRLFGGDVTARLIASAPTPVVVVPEGCSPETAKAVVVALDARTAADGALSFAFTEAARSGMELQVLHVFSTGKTFRQIGSVRARISDILAQWTEKFPDVPIKDRFVFNDVDAGCLRVGREAGLLVVGRQPISLATVFFGHPVLSEISRGARCPYVVVPEEWRPSIAERGHRRRQPLTTQLCVCEKGSS